MKGKGLAGVFPLQSSAMKRDFAMRGARGIVAAADFS
jgi:hypothetical protein